MDTDLPHRCGPFGALRHVFEIRGHDRELVEHAAHILGPLGTEPNTGGVSVYELSVRPDGGLRVSVDGQLLRETRSPGRALAHLLWHVNQEAVRHTDDRVLLHAAAVARGGKAVVLPAAMEAGKTTLVAGLVARGFAYLSDELGALDPDTLSVEAYPKPLSIDAGSWDVLAHLRPVLPPALEASTAGQWHVPATDVPGGRLEEQAVPALLLWPQYEEGARTRLEPVAAGEMVAHMVGQTFRFEERPRRDFRALVRLAEHCPAYRLVLGDLARGCAAVAEVFADVCPSSRGPSPAWVSPSPVG